MWAWPNLVLTDYEKQFVRIYKSAKYPGVLKRVYKITLNDFADLDQRLPVIQLGDQIQIARRSRVFGLTFAGNLDSWRLQITNASGTLYTVRTPRTGLDPVVSSLVPSTMHNALAIDSFPSPPGMILGSQSDAIGPYPQQAPAFMGGQHQPAPLLIDPNWLLLPNETLIFNGTPLPVNYPDVEAGNTPAPLILHIGIHVWEFPKMGTAPAKEREVL
jgi:hypothetical protein